MKKGRRILAYLPNPVRGGRNKIKCSEDEQ